MHCGGLEDGRLKVEVKHLCPRLDLISPMKITGGIPEGLSSNENGNTIGRLCSLSYPPYTQSVPLIGTYTGLRTSVMV